MVRTYRPFAVEPLACSGNLRLKTDQLPRASRQCVEIQSYLLFPAQSSSKFGPLAFELVHLHGSVTHDRTVDPSPLATCTLASVAYAVKSRLRFSAINTLSLIECIALSDRASGVAKPFHRPVVRPACKLLLHGL